MTDEDLRRRLAHLESEVRAARAFEQAPYRAVVEDMTELVVRWKPGGSRVFVNDAYCRLFATSREQVLGTPFWNRVHEEDRAAVEERIASLSPDVPVSTGRHRAVGPGGRIIWMEWCDRVLFDDEWQVVEYQSVGRDVTERVQLDRKLRQLVRADAAARTAAGLAHDLANMMTVVAARVAQLEQLAGIADGPATVAVERVLSLLSRLKGRLSQAPIGDLEEVDLNIQVEASLNILGELVGPLVQIHARLDAEDTLIVADSLQIDQILLNLVQNAAEAYGSAAGTIIISTANDPVATPEEGRNGEVHKQLPTYCVLRVSDQAGGIDPEVLPQVFEARFTTKQQKGRGLGLATVKGIVDAHNASIRVEASQPAGTTFEIAFPVKQASQPA